MRNSILIITLILFFSCERNELLNKKTSSLIKTIESLDEVEYILKNKFLFDWESNIPTLITDEIQISNSTNLNLNKRDSSFYYWQDDFILQNEDFEDWNYYYSKILSTNSIIAYYKDNNLNNKDSFYLSSAYYIRAKTYFDLMLLYCDHDPQSTYKLGVPIRLLDNIDEKIIQHSLKVTYEFIKADIESSINLSINNIHRDLNIPFNNLWIQAFAARFYLYIKEYSNALKYANNIIQSTNNPLVNFNLYTNQNPRLFLQPEVIGVINYFNDGTYLINFQLNQNHINSEIINSYHNYDKRKVMFYTLRNGNYIYRNPYINNNFSLFSGYTFSELYLIKMESEWRLNLNTQYLETVNYFISKRYSDNPYSNEYISSLDFIIHERSKELIMRNLKLYDVKRLYNDGIIIQLKKILQQTEVILTAVDARINIIYPESVTKNYGIIQVKR